MRVKDSPDSTEEVDLKGLSPRFIMEVMKKCYEDHRYHHCECMSRDERWDGEWDDDLEKYVYREDHPQYSPENIKLEDWSGEDAVVKFAEVDANRWGHTHEVSFIYTNGYECPRCGRRPQWGALYGVNEDTGDISLYAD